MGKVEKREREAPVVESKILFILPYSMYSAISPGQNREKIIDLTTKLGEINAIEHYKVAKYIIKVKLF